VTTSRRSDGASSQWCAFNSPTVTQLFYRTGAATWGPWRLTGFADAIEQGASVNLNNLTTPGLYSQQQNAETGVALNYPVALAGLLEVFIDGGSETLIWQRYTVYGTGSGTNRTYTRSKNGANWSAWVALMSSPLAPARITNAFAATSGWSITEQEAFLIQPNILSVVCAFKRTGGTITVGSSGDIGNVQVGTFSATYSLPHTFNFGLASGWRGRTSDLMITPLNEIYLTGVGGTADIATNDEVSMAGLIPLTFG
jgi:hypothetical protein